MNRHKLIQTGAVTAGVVAILLTWALALGGPPEAKPMAAIHTPFKNLKQDDIPPVGFIRARDGQRLAFRRYQPAAGTAGPTSLTGSAILIHGSSASNVSMHQLAQSIAAQGKWVYALDIRSHGQSVTSVTKSNALRVGHAAYVGQLDDDMADVLSSLRTANQLPQPISLIGFSSGGGYALKLASGKLANWFEDAVLMAPMLSHRAPTYRHDSGGWVTVGIPRIAALMGLHAMGFASFGHLPVVRFAVAQGNPARLTEAYDFNMQQSFGPPTDYEAAIASLKPRTSVIVGANDEAFFASEYAPLFARLNPKVAVSVIPDVGHTSLIVDPRGHNAVINALATR